MTNQKLNNDINEGVDKTKLLKLIKESFSGKNYVTIDEIPSLVDKHFKGIQDLLEQEKSADNRVRVLFGLNETSYALSYLLKSEFERILDIEVKNNSRSQKESDKLTNLRNTIKLFNEKECEGLNLILTQYGESIKVQDLKSVSVFEAIKLFFENILAKFKTNDEHTVKYNSIFYCYNSDQENDPSAELKQKHESQVTNKEARSNKFQPTLETIAEKPIIPPKSQKVLDVGEKIMAKRNQSEAPCYTSKLEVILSSEGQKVDALSDKNVNILQEKKSQGGKMIEKTNNKEASLVVLKPSQSQAKEGYGKNVASKKQFFEALNTGTNQKPKSKVEGLVEKFESMNQNTTTAVRSR